ncbi:hypothetical protein JVU11DRAFT_3917 [Chiua virens]|nr:hypothetical protein JVU11DRAFT_3917 [Chiua virens]
MDSELPGYSELSSESLGLTAAAGSSSNTPRAGSQHIVSLEDAKGFKWLTLQVNSRASTPSSIPIFYEGDVVSGQVHFDALKSESIKGISVKMTAGTTLVGQEEQLFLNTEADLWTPSMALPDGSKAAKFSRGKGRSARPKDQEKFPLPTSFSERASTAYVDYKLAVTVKRGMFQLNKVLVTAFAYAPTTRPELPSRMLQKAYKENLPLVGPEGEMSEILNFLCLMARAGDPDGWYSLPPLMIQGKLFDSRITEHAHSSPLRNLKRRTSPRPPLNPKRDQTSPYNCFFENVARAVFWAPEDYRTEGQRILQGEIDVKTSLRPSTLFPRFTIRYHLDLQPFEVAGFVVTAPKTTPLLRQKVTISNFPALGIPIRMHAPPEYVQEQGADYNKSVGLLENGNQRFFHHGGTGGI